MIKITTTLLFFTLLFTACAERGAVLTPKIVKQEPVVKKTFICKKKRATDTKKIKIETTKNISSPTKSYITAIPKKQVKISKSPAAEKNPINSDDLFSFSEKTKNRISGFFIFVIGLIIFI